MDRWIALDPLYTLVLRLTSFCPFIIENSLIHSIINFSSSEWTLTFVVHQRSCCSLEKGACEYQRKIVKKSQRAAWCCTSRVMLVTFFQAHGNETAGSVRAREGSLRTHLALTGLFVCVKLFSYMPCCNGTLLEPCFRVFMKRVWI